uniref:Thrombospondin-like N-terminal domain-containing protein n=1 Tax=Sinocyclocheilus grahami TaxID=75366 RepID=A0A672NHQ2_SINGR
MRYCPTLVSSSCKPSVGYVDVLQRLGLVGKRPSGTRFTPQGVIPFKSGVILTQRARIDVPVSSVIPASLGSAFCLILSVCSHRINNAFLFTIVTKRKQLQLGVQFIPGQILVYLGQKNTVNFDYDVHNGQWHNLALEIQTQSVTLYTSCGKTSVHANLHFKNEEMLDPEGSFRLGKMSQNSVQFEGAICQFDIHPSAKAAHNYCKYIKKQCREADTYRPNLPPLLPHLSLAQEKVHVNHETSQGLNTSVLITSQSVQSTVPPTIAQPTLQLPLQATAQTAMASFGSRTSQISPKPTQQSNPRKNIMKASVKPQILIENEMAVTGHEGVYGERGNPGAPGLPGPKGKNGPHGESGSRGSPVSKFLILVVISQGTVGLPGPRGVVGREGLEGDPGVEGALGKDGAKGIPGEHGSDGEVGLPGKSGPQGNGERGIPGQTGPPGKRGFNGGMGFPGKHGDRGVKGQPVTFRFGAEPSTGRISASVRETAGVGVTAYQRGLPSRLLKPRRAAASILRSRRDLPWALQRFH